MPAVDARYVHETLAQLVRINSINPAFAPDAPGEAAIADWVAANLPTETKEAPKQAPPEPGALKG